MKPLTLRIEDFEKKLSQIQETKDFLKEAVEQEKALRYQVDTWEGSIDSGAAQKLIDQLDECAQSIHDLKRSIKTQVNQLVIFTNDNF